MYRNPRSKEPDGVLCLTDRQWLMQAIQNGSKVDVENIGVKYADKYSVHTVRRTSRRVPRISRPDSVIRVHISG